MTKYAGTLAKSISQSFFLALKTETRQEEETMLGHFVQTDKQTNSQIMSKDKKNRTCWPSLNSQASSLVILKFVSTFSNNADRRELKYNWHVWTAPSEALFYMLCWKLMMLTKVLIYITTVWSMEYMQHLENANPYVCYVVCHNCATFIKSPTMRHWALKLGA